MMIRTVFRQLKMTRELQCLEALLEEQAWTNSPNFLMFTGASPVMRQGQIPRRPDG